MKRTYSIPQTEILKVYGTNDVLQMPDQPGVTLSGSGAKDGYNMAPSRNTVGTKLYI